MPLFTETKGAGMVDVSELISILLLRDYNTRLVVISTILLGVNCGLIGSFLLLRKRALMGDALSHATLPGIGLAFILLTALAGTAKSVLGLVIGAAISGLIATFSIGLSSAIRALSKMPQWALCSVYFMVLEWSC